MKFKKIAALLLSLMMIVTSLPAKTFAAYEPVVAPEVVSEEEELEYLKQQLEQIPISITGIDAITSGAALAMYNASVKTAQNPTDTLTVASDSVTVAHNAGTYTLTVIRPKGLEALYPVSIDFRFIAGSIGIGARESGRLTFMPGDESKTITVEIPDGSSEFISWNGRKTFFLQFYTPHRTSINHDLITFNVTKSDAVSTGTAVKSSLSVNQLNLTVGQTVPIVVMFRDGSDQDIALDITNGHTLTVERNSDNTTSVLQPLEAGSAGASATYLYSITNADIDNGSDNLNVTLTDTINLDSDISAAGLFHIKIPPAYGAVTTDKPAYDSDETVIVTIPVANADVIEGSILSADLLQDDTKLREWFALSIDGGISFVDPQNISYDSTTNAITVELTAPVNIESDQEPYYPEVYEISNEIDGGSPISVYTAIFGATATFNVNGNGTGGELIPITAMDITNIPTSGTISKFDMSVSLGVNIEPADATYKTGYTWTSSNTAVAEITSADLITPKKTGTVTFTLKSNELTYRESKGETINAALLQLLEKTVTINITGTAPVFNMASVVGTVGIDIPIEWSWNLWDGSSRTFTIKVLDNNGNQVGDTHTVTAETRFDPLRYTVPASIINNWSLEERGEYKPAYTVEITTPNAEAPGELPDEVCEGYIIISPPKPTVSILASPDGNDYIAGSASSTQRLIRFENLCNVGAGVRPDIQFSINGAQVQPKEIYYTHDVYYKGLYNANALLEIPLTSPSSNLAFNEINVLATASNGVEFTVRAGTRLYVYAGDMIGVKLVDSAGNEKLVENGGTVALSNTKDTAWENLNFARRIDLRHTQTNRRSLK